MHHLYIQHNSSGPALQKEREALEQWCKANNITNYNWIEDNLHGRISPEHVEALLKPIQHGDTVIATDIATLGRSLPMLLQVMTHLLEHRCSLITIHEPQPTPTAGPQQPTPAQRSQQPTPAQRSKPAMPNASARTLQPNRTMTLFVNHLREIVTIESQMKAKRLTTVMKMKREEGVTLGRPKGSSKSPEKSVLYGKESQIQTLLSQGKNDGEIAAALGVSRNTIRNYRISHRS